MAPTHSVKNIDDMFLKRSILPIKQEERDEETFDYFYVKPRETNKSKVADETHNPESSNFSSAVDAAFTNNIVRKNREIEETLKTLNDEMNMLLR